MRKLSRKWPLGLCVVVLLLGCGCKRDSADPDILLQAAESGDLVALQEYIGAGGDVNARFAGQQHEGETALHVAAAGGHVAFIRALLEHGALVNSTDRSGHTPLFYAVFGEEASVAAIPLLVEAGATVDQRDYQGITPAGRAAAQGSLAKLNALLALGANLNIIDNDGWTVLDHALDSPARNEQLVELLLKHGAKTGKQAGE